MTWAGPGFVQSDCHFLIVILNHHFFRMILCLLLVGVLHKSKIKCFKHVGLPYLVTPVTHQRSMVGPGGTPEKAVPHDGSNASGGQLMGTNTYFEQLKIATNSLRNLAVFRSTGIPLVFFKPFISGRPFSRLKPITLPGTEWNARGWNVDST